MMVKDFIVKRIILLLIFICPILSFCFAQNIVDVRKAIDIMDKYGLFAKGTDWEAAKKEALVQEPESVEQAKDIIKKALKVAGGKHSFIMSSDTVNKYNSEVNWLMPSVCLNDNGDILIITIPRFGGNRDKAKEYAESVLENHLVKTLKYNSSVKGVVIDLRNNTGGNMYPMIAAVHQFLPKGKLIGFKSRKHTVWYNNRSVREVVLGKKEYDHIDMPVAILTNKRTISSGEAVLICFRGLKNVRSFGSATAGYASGNSSFVLSDGSKLILTTGCDVARTNEVFCDDPIVPDVETDNPLEEAISWLINLH